MSEFKQYRRKKIAELRPVNPFDILMFNSDKELRFITDIEDVIVSISDADLKNGSPKLGDMIARNPENYFDQWLVSEDYFKDNFEEIQ